MSKSFTTQTNFAFPSLNIKDSEKDESWHKKYVQAIVFNSLNSAYDFDNKVMNDCYNFYQGMQGGDEFEFLQNAEDGEVLPAQWINYNKIKVKIDLLLGELSEKGYQLNVKAINKEAKVRKLEAKEQMRITMRLQELSKDLEERYGLPLQNGQPVPEDEEELEEQFENYKEETEIVIDAALKFLAKRNNWDYERLAMFRDILIAGKCFAKSEIINDVPKIRRIDPRYMIYDKHVTDDYLSDATYYGEVRYMSISDAVDQFNLDKKELDEVYTAFKNSENGVNLRNRIGDFQALTNSSLEWFTKEDKEMRVLVISGTWKDTKPYNHKISKDKYGGEHVKFVGGKEGKDTKKARVDIWRQGTLIGGVLLKEWGEIPNQNRNIDNLSYTDSPYFGLIPNYLQYRGVSKVDQLKGLQKLKDITMYNIQLQMARAGAKGFVYDTSQTPEGWDVHTVIKYLKTVGIAFIDSAKDGIPAGFNQFQQIDLSLSSSVNQYLEISQMIDREMDAISGINEARQGIVQNSSQAVGVTQSALLQSNLSTASYFRSFNRFSSHLWTHQAGLVKIAWENNETFAPIIGDVGIDFLSTAVDIELDDYGVFIEETPPMLDDIQSFQQLVMAALQAGQLGFVEAMKLLQEKDIVQAVRKLERTMKKKELEALKQQQMQMQQEQQAAQAQQQAQAQAAAQQAQQEQAGKLELEERKSAGDIRKELIKGKMNMGAKRIDMLNKQ